MAAATLRRLWRLYRYYVPSEQERRAMSEAMAAFYPTKEQRELRWRHWHYQDRRMNLLMIVALGTWIFPFVVIAAGIVR